MAFHRRCPCCHKTKPIYEFSTDRTRKNGIGQYCKMGKSARSRNYNKTHRIQRNLYTATYRLKHRKQQSAHEREYYKKHKERVVAKNTLHRGVKKGTLAQIFTKKCSLCGKQAVQYHHPSYAPKHRLDVIPLCRKCHYSQHKKIA